VVVAVLDYIVPIRLKIIEEKEGEDRMAGNIVCCVRRCPSCGADIELDNGFMIGDILECPDCGMELEIRKPHQIDLKELARKHEGFDPSWVDLSVSPTLVPAPMEEEDFGE